MYFVTSKSSFENVYVVISKSSFLKLFFIRSKLYLPPPTSNIYAINAQITASHEQVDHLNHAMGRNRAELQLLQETVEKRRQQLDSLDTQLECEIASRRLEIKLCNFFYISHISKLSYDIFSHSVLYCHVSVFLICPYFLGEDGPRFCRLVHDLRLLSSSSSIFIIVPRFSSRTVPSL